MKKIAVALFVLFAFSACARVEDSAQKKFGNDSNYFLALKEAEKGNQKDAIRLLKIARKKGTSLIAKKSAESLTLLGSVKDRLEAAEFLAEQYHDEESLAISVREFFSHGEYAKVISLTDGISLENAKNEIIKYRLLALSQKKDGRFTGEFYDWVVSRPLSSEHLELYSVYLAFLRENNLNIQKESENFQKNLNKRSLLESQLAPKLANETDSENKSENPQKADSAKSDGISASESENQNQNSENSDSKKLSIVPEEGFEPLFDALQEAENPEKTIIDYRVAVFHRSYKLAFSQIDKIFKIYENRGEEIDSQLLSDVGKATLYGTENYFASARNFDRLAEKFSPEKAYFAHFYAARLYDKAGRYPRQTVSRFKKALECTEDALQFDNCLWYLLNFQLRTSTDDIISTLTEYGSRIHDSEYFDDFFESLSILLLSSHRWQDFYKVWKKTDSNFSEYTAGKYAYISGRLIEEGLAQGDDGLKTRQAVEAFMRVLNSGASLYYKVCALERLNVTDTSLIDSYLFNKNGKNSDKTEKNEEKGNGKNSEISEISEKNAGILLKGYAAFGFPERLYPEWISNRKNISIEDTIEISEFLQKCAERNKDSAYSVQSLRIASRCFEASGGEIPKKLMELTFPKNYEEIIKNASEEFGVPDYLLYALVRSESFFEASVTSKAGANGLTQLMEATANDEARKLKLGEDYDIFDAETNVRMGAHYLSSLISRTDDNNELLALYAYNAGLTNVRSWGTRFRRDWATTGKAAHKPVGISMDLFLESLPFAETREYGRKVVSAAALYAYLYDGKLPGDTVREIMY